MPKKQLVVTGVILLLVLGALFLVPKLVTQSNSSEPSAPIPAPASTSKFHFDPNVQTWYRNDKPSFSFRVPQGFTAPNGSILNGKGQEVVVINAEQDAALILAYPIVSGADTELTEDIVVQNSPEEHPSNFKKTSLTEGTRGIFFSTDSKVWDGEGVAFWFTHGGYLYELSTARKNSDLLALIMQTFFFPDAQKK